MWRGGLWVLAADLQPGMAVLSATGTSGAVEALIPTDRVQPMHNLEVDAAHTYFVGDGQWVVHNGCDFSRMVSSSEAQQIERTGQLELPTSGPGNRREKWVARGELGNNVTFGSSSNYTHRVEIDTAPGTWEWLQRNAVDEIDYRIALEDNLEYVPGTNMLTQNVIALSKENEPGWFGLTAQGLGLFNRNIDSIDVVQVR
ncbi:hypothetical protein HC928_05910 [bacterium]|nr:hypothetical protein [bacterium]